MHLANTIELVHWSRLNAGDCFVFGGSGKHQLRRRQHAELGYERRDQYRHHARNVHFRISERFNEREPDGDDYLHVDCYECGRLYHLNAYRYRNDGGQTKHQLVHSERYKYHFGLKQHTELGDDGRDQYRHHSRNLHVHISEWFNEREPNRDDDLHIDCYQCGRLNYVDGTGRRDGPGRSINDHHYFLPRRNTRRGVCRLHNHRQRRHSALHVFAQHG
jgi:hypothetical protein